MATARDGGRPRRPTGTPWLDRKYSGQPSELTVKAERVLAELVKTPGVPRPVRLPSPDPEYARAFTNALNTARRRYNRGRPENEQISVTARPADPRTGRCVNCDRPDSACRQTPPGLICLHAKTVSRDEGLAYVLGHYGATPEEWEANGGYNPHRPKPRRRDQDAGQPSRSYDPGPGKRFGADKIARSREPVPDEPPPGPKVFGGGSPRRRQPEPRKDPKVPAGKGAEEPGREPLLTRIRRSLG